MVAIHTAYTRQINPEGVTPTLTRAQIWKGLERKVRKAQDFVPVIAACKVLEDKGNMVIREATFKAGPDSVPGRGDTIVREVCNLFEPTRVDFHQPNGAVIMNCISDGPGMTENDLNMTYIFEFLHNDIEVGSKDYKNLVEEHRQGAKMAVDKSIEAMRKMAAAGEL